MDESRKQFEEWFEINDSEYRANGVGSVQIARLRHRAWEAWKASRESLKKYL